jgi:hypothetical protein
VSAENSLFLRGKFTILSAENSPFLERKIHYLLLARKCPYLLLVRKIHYYERGKFIT